MHRKVDILKTSLSKLILQELKFLRRIESAKGIHLSILNIHINVNTFFIKYIVN